MSEFQPEIRSAAEGFDATSYELIPVNLTYAQCVVEILAQADRPLRARQIRAALEDYPIKPADVMTHLLEFAEAGLIKKFSRELYGSLEHDDGDIHPADRTITENICDILEAAGQEMSPLEVAAAVSDRRNQVVNPKSIRTILNQLSRQGRIQRLGRGIYTGQGYDRLNYQPESSISIQIVAIIEAATRPLSAEVIISQLEIDDNQPDPRRGNIRQSLSNLVKQGRIRRFGWGLYGSLEHDDGDIHPADKTITENICDILEAAGQEMSPLEVTAAVSDRRNQVVNPLTIQMTLKRLSGQDRIQRLGRGIYARLDYDGSIYRQLPIGERIIDCLEKSRQSLSLKQIFEIITADGDGPTSLRSLDMRLRNFWLEEQIQRFDDKTYASLDYRPSSDQWLLTRPEKPTEGTLAANVV